MFIMANQGGDIAFMLLKRIAPNIVFCQASQLISQQYILTETIEF